MESQSEPKTMREAAEWLVNILQELAESEKTKAEMLQTLQREANKTDELLSTVLSIVSSDEYQQAFKK